MSSGLKLFRRHEVSCSQHYPKDHRIYESDSPKTTGKRQCRCPIYAEGTLRTDSEKQYLRPKSTGERDWKKARRTASRWEGWGDVRPVPKTTADSAYELKTVGEAVSTFLEVKSSQNASIETVRQFRQLLEKRLVPFANAKGIRYIQQMDNAQIWGEFRGSWRNLNPLRNRKPRAGENIEAGPVAPSTAQRLVQQVREFIRVCISREWLSDNWASSQHGMKVTTSIEPKEPFSNQELEAVYKATEYVTDGHGAFGQSNAKELLVFVWVLRYTGLRISDAVLLERSQLVPFEHSTYTHALYCHPRKTRTKRQANFVHIPIPHGNLPGHPDLVGALSELPLKNGRYFFYGGTGSLRTNVTSWRNRLSRLFKLAAERMAKQGKMFANKPYPHRFRHTFAATLLQNGVSLRVVAQYLGDTEDIVRKHYAKFCLAEQREAADTLAEAMLKMVTKEKKQGGTKQRAARTKRR